MTALATSEVEPCPRPSRARSRPTRGRARARQVRWITPEGQAALKAALGEARGARTPDADARAALLEATLAVLTVRGPEGAPEGEVAFARWVTVVDLGDGRRTTWRLVGPDEAEPRRGLLSAHAPLGRALLGRSAGDVVELERPGGARQLRIEAVSLVPPTAR